MSRIWAGVLTAGPCTDITSLHHRSLTDPEGQLLTLTRGSAFNRSPEDFYERGLDQEPGAPGPQGDPRAGPAQARLHDRPLRRDRRARRLRRAGRDPVDPRGALRGRGVRRGAHAPRGHDRRRAWWPRPRSSSACSCPATSSTWSGRSQGTPRNRIRVERLDSADATAGNLFNRIPDIIAAPPGIVPVTELGPLMSSAARWPTSARVSPAPLRLSVDELMATAREVAGVDLVDDEVVEPLTVLHRALGKERAQLDAEGARAFEQKLLRLLANRLRMKRDVLRHPEIAEQPITGPVIVMGTARSGTTKLQKALAASGDFNFLTFWQAFNWASVTRRAERADRGTDRRGRGLLPLVRRTLARDEAGPLLRGARARGGGRPDRGVASSPRPSSASPRSPATGGGWASSRRPSSSSSSATR